jgi:hypothetical protein
MEFSFPIARTNEVTPTAAQSWIGQQCTVADGHGIVQRVETVGDQLVVTVSVDDDTDAAHRIAGNALAALSIRVPPVPTLVQLTVTTRADPSGHVPVMHERGYHDNDYTSSPCMFCDGNLSACSVCGAFEGAWPDECPSERITSEQSNAVYLGQLNFRAGAWRPDECCQVMRPVRDREALLHEINEQADPEV